MHYQGLAYRAHNPYWSFKPTSGEGAKTHGGRFNPPGTPALYLSLQQTTALAEYNQGFPHRPQPATLCAYNIDCDDLVDLRDEAVRLRFSTSPGVLRCPWELMVVQGQRPDSWILAEQLIQVGYAGIIVPSFAGNAPPAGSNLALWDWSDNLPHRVNLIDDDNWLPKDQSSWPEK